MQENILSLSDEILGQIFREIYTPYEKDIRSMFEHQRSIKITIEQVVEVFHRHGLTDYSVQLYMFFYGLYLGVKEKSSKEVYHEVHALIAAYRMADELGVDLSNINPEEALKYYQSKRN